MEEETAPRAPNHPSSEHDNEDEEGGEEAAESLRSRASSVISTGTRISILTLPQSDSASQRNVDGLLTNPTAASTSRLVPRPTSIYSFRSMGEVLPPYSEVQFAPTTGTGRSAAERPQMSSERAVTGETVSQNPENENDNENNNATKGAEDDENAPNHPDPPPTTSSPSSPQSDPDPEPDTDSANANALARHYGTIVRTIDENHKRLISRLTTSHAQDLATVRNAIDGEYRKVLRSRNQELEREREASGTRESALEARIAALEREIEDMKREAEEKVADVRRQGEEKVEKECVRARHLVEDLWEERWVKRNEVAAEEARRSEREWRETVREMVEGERERWESGVERVWGGRGLGVLRRAMVEEEEEEGEGEGEEEEGAK